MLTWFFPRGLFQVSCSSSAGETLRPIMVQWNMSQPNLWGPTSTCPFLTRQGFEVTTHEKLRYFWKPSRSEPKQLTCYCSFTDFLLFLQKPQSESRNRWLLWKSFLLNGENWLHFLWCASFLTFLELPCDRHLSCFVLTSSDTAKLYDVEWTMSNPWPSDFTAGSFLGSPQKQTITNVLPPNKFLLTQPKDREVKVQTLFSY